ncbi:MAG: PAS domain-containing protein [Pseudomonadota bacterium]
MTPPSSSTLRLVQPTNAPSVPEGLDASFLKSILDSSMDCIKVVSVDGTLTYMNENGMCAMEIDDFTMVGGKKWYDLWPESAKGEIMDSITTAAKGTPSRFEAFCPTAKGTPRWWEVTVSPMREADGKVRSMVSISRDVTDRVQSFNRIKMHEMEMQALIVEQAEALHEQKIDLESRDVMLQEIDHRMKNSLSMLNSLLRMEARNASSPEAKQKIANANSRIASIAKAHEQLFDHADVVNTDGRVAVDRYLVSLCNELKTTVDNGAVEISVSADEEQMESAQAVSLGLVTAELVMNAARHASSETACAINVSYKTHDGKRVLEVGDDGCGLPDGFDPGTSSGLGMRVIMSSATKLGADLTFGNRDKGAFFRLTF